MDERTYDLVLYGATGLTGRQAAAYLASHQDASRLRWAVAGRDGGRVEALARELTSGEREVGAVVADAENADAVDRMVRETRVVASTAGPFALYGDKVVEACVRHETHYADITGETVWVRRLIDRHHHAAARDGTRIVPFCGFDSVPSDLGALLAVRALGERSEEGCGRVKGFYQLRGGLNGGTLASLLELFASGGEAELRDPFLLSPDEGRTDEDRRDEPDQRRPLFDADMHRYTAPFLMAPVNTRVVRRSRTLSVAHGESYGEGFRYSESLLMSGHHGWRRAWRDTLRLHLMLLLLRRGLGRRLLRWLGPAPGTGPSEAVREGGFFRCTFVGEAEGGGRVRVAVADEGDPGNRVTTKILCESALALALDGDELPGGAWRGGILTPASALGMVLVERLRRAGMHLGVIEE